MEQKSMGEEEQSRYCVDHLEAGAGEDSVLGPRVAQGWSERTSGAQKNRRKRWW